MASVEPCIDCSSSTAAELEEPRVATLIVIPRVMVEAARTTTSGNK